MKPRAIGNGLMYVGDNLDVMKTFPDRFVSATVTSPPYEGQRTYGIDFKLIGQAWVDWMIPRVVEMCRVTDGLVFINAAGPVRKFKYSTSMEWLVSDLTRLHGIVWGPAPYVFQRVGIPGSGGPHYHRRDWEPIYSFAIAGRLPPAWSDNTAFGHPPKWAPGGSMSHMLTDGTRINQWGKTGTMTGTTAAGSKEKATIGKPRPSHKTMYGNRPSEACGREGYKKTYFNGKGHKATRGNKAGDTKTEAMYDPPVIANPGNVIQLNVGGGQMGHELAHENEAPFPLELPARFIAWFVPPGGKVLDPFMGSGTTAHAAEDSGRGWIGIDARESQAELVSRRIGSLTPALFA